MEPSDNSSKARAGGPTAAPALAPTAASAAAKPRRFVMLRRALITLVVLLLLYTLFGFFGLPAIVKAKLPEIAAEQLDRPTSVERIRFNPFTLHLLVDQLKIDGKPGPEPALTIRQLDVDASWRSLWRRAPVLSSVKVIEPALHVRRDADGRYDFQDLIDKAAQQPPSDGPTPKFSITNIELSDGRVTFDDRLKKATHEVADIGIRVPFVSSLPIDEQVLVEPHLQAKINGSPFVAEGTSQPFSPTRDSSLKIDLDNVDLTEYTPYVPIELPVKLVSGMLDLDLQVKFSQPPAATPVLEMSGKTALSKVDVQELGGEPLVKWAALKADGLALKPLEQRFEIGAVSLDGLQAVVQRRAGQTRFFQSVLDALERAKPASVPSPASKPDPKSSTAASTPAKSEPLFWKVGSVAVNAAQVEFGDALFEPKPLNVKVDALNLTASPISSEQGSKTDYRLQAHTTQNESLATEGQVRLSPMAIDGRFQVEPVALAPWWWVVEPMVQLDLLDGKLAASGRYQVADARGQAAAQGSPRIQLADLGARLSDVKLRQRWDKATLMSVGVLEVADTSVDLDQRRVVVGTVSGNKAAMSVLRERDGTLNLERIMAKGKPADSRPANPRAAPARAVAAKPVAGKSAAEKRSDPAGDAPWDVELGKLKLEHYLIDVQDRTMGRPADLKVDLQQLVAQGLGTAANKRGSVALVARFNQRGSLKVNGPLQLNPVATRLAIDARDLSILPVQPYVRQYVNARVSGGLVSMRGNADVQVPAKGPARISYKGDAALNQFAAVSRDAKDDLLRWKALAVDGIDLTVEPLKVDIARIALSDFYSRLFINPQGRFNLQDLLVKAGEPEPDLIQRTPPPGAGARGRAGQLTGPVASAPKKDAAPASKDATSAAAEQAASDQPPLPIRIGEVAFDGGNIDFSDFFIRPNYSVNLTGMAGTIKNLSPENAGALDLKGRIDNAGSVAIQGQLNPLAKDLEMDIVANARDIDLPRLSPYSSKYIGYGIQKGQLSAEVKYKIADRQLTAENKIVLDQLTLGERSTSPDAPNLPVQFALSLLKDRNGVIDVDLPIGGSLDDPQFSIAGLVVRMFVNLIVKAVTAPFSLLSGLGGSGDQKSPDIVFAAGRATLEPASEQRLKDLAKALADRPALKLELAGRADPGRDQKELVDLALQRAIKAQKLKDTVRGGTDAAGVDAVQVSPEEYPKYLQRAYRAADFDKPRNALGMVKSVPVPEMEKALRDHVTIGESELRDLASRRAQAVKDYLAGQGKIAGDRLYIVSSKIGPPDKDEKADSGVGLTLKGS